MAEHKTRRILKWSVGITTCPRKDGSLFLNKTLDSINKAGWDDNSIVIFAEPNSNIPSNFDGEVIFRRKQYGDWTNWATGLYELLLSEPDTDFFLMSEDDVIYNKDSKEYLELSFPYLKNFGSLSLYTPSLYHKRKFCGWHNECRGVETWSTVTVIMSKESVIQFFANEDTQRHRFQDIFHAPEIQWGVTCDPKNSVKDAVLGHWAKKTNKAIYYHTPALAQHIGTRSTISDNEASIINNRQAIDFVGENTDIEMLKPRVLNFWQVPL